MSTKSVTMKAPAAQVAKDFRRASCDPASDTRCLSDGCKLHASDEKIRIVLSGSFCPACVAKMKHGRAIGANGHATIAALCRKQGSAKSLCYSCAKEYLEAGKKRLADGAAPHLSGNTLGAIMNGIRNR